MLVGDCSKFDRTDEEIWRSDSSLSSLHNINKLVTIPAFHLGIAMYYGTIICQNMIFVSITSQEILILETLSQKIRNPETLQFYRPWGWSMQELRAGLHQWLDWQTLH